MASRKITRSTKKTSAASKPTPATRSPAAPAAKKAAPTAAARTTARPAARPVPSGPTKPAPILPPRKPVEPPAPASRAGYLQAGLDALVRRVRLRDQAEAKRLEPAIAHLVKAYEKLLGKP
jgi:hypothetical protein